MAQDTYTALVDVQEQIVEADRLLGSGERRAAHNGFEQAIARLFVIGASNYCRDAEQMANRVRGEVISKLFLSLLDGGAPCWQASRDRIKARSAAVVVEMANLVRKYQPE